MKRVFLILFFSIHSFAFQQIPVLTFPEHVHNLTEIEIDSIKRWIPFIDASYCIDGLEDWTCLPCNSTEFAHGTTNITFAGKYDTMFGYTSLHSPSQSIVIALRGTRNLDNWINNLFFAKPDAPFPRAPKKAAVHYGFLKSFYEVRPDLIKNYIKLRKKFPLYSIRFVGHSLGGAVATLASLDLYLLGLLPLNQTSIYTIGSPRVGNSVFAEWVSSLFPTQHSRVVNQNDLTPHLPPMAAGFEHSGREIFIVDDQGTTVECLTDKELEGNESKECSNSYAVHSIKQHGSAWNERIGYKSCFAINNLSH